VNKDKQEIRKFLNHLNKFCPGLCRACNSDLPGISEQDFRLNNPKILQAGGDMSRIYARVKGIVQGVGFRYFVIRNAERLNLKGYVRNRPDGDVEVEAEGDDAALQSLIDELHRGPHLARVDDVQVKWFKDEKGYKEFRLEW